MVSHWLGVSPPLRAGDQGSHSRGIGPGFQCQHQETCELSTQEFGLALQSVGAKTAVGAIGAVLSRRREADGELELAEFQLELVR